MILPAVSPPETPTLHGKFMAQLKELKPCDKSTLLYYSRLYVKKLVTLHSVTVKWSTNLLLESTSVFHFPIVFIYVFGNITNTNV
jgi:hypothetical protein